MGRLRRRPRSSEAGRASAPPAYQGLCYLAGKSRQLLVQYPAQKYSPFVLMQISSSLCRPIRQEGRLAIVTNARWDAVDADGALDVRA
jgi:hypothetical protein